MTRSGHFSYELIFSKGLYGLVSKSLPPELLETLSVLTNAPVYVVSIFQMAHISKIYREQVAHSKDHILAM